VAARFNEEASSAAQCVAQWISKTYVRFCYKRIESYVRPGLPDGLFTNQKSHFGSILEGFAMEDISALYGHSVYFTAIWYIFVAFMVIWYIFPRFGMLYQNESGNPG
jgi:hypothetical protein